MLPYSSACCAKSSLCPSAVTALAKDYAQVELCVCVLRVCSNTGAESGFGTCAVPMFAQDHTQIEVSVRLRV
jgi:hypothetical protein